MRPVDLWWAEGRSDPSFPRPKASDSVPSGSASRDSDDDRLRPRGVPLISHPRTAASFPAGTFRSPPGTGFARCAAPASESSFGLDSCSLGRRGLGNFLTRPCGLRLVASASLTNLRTGTSDCTIPSSSATTATGDPGEGGGGSPSRTHPPPERRPISFGYSPLERPSRVGRPVLQIGSASPRQSPRSQRTQEDRGLTAISVTATPAWSFGSPGEGALPPFRVAFILRPGRQRRCPCSRVR
jgi:hypothetical protein